MQTIKKVWVNGVFDVLNISKPTNRQDLKISNVAVKYKTFFESIEDLELLRLLESGVKVKCRFLDYHAHHSVDTLEDLVRVRGEYGY